MFSRFLPRKSVVWETFFWKLFQPKYCHRSGLLSPPNVINVVIKNVKNVVTKNVPQFFYKTHRKSHESHFYYSCRLKGEGGGGRGGCNLIKEETPAQVFSCEFWDIFENTSFKEYFQTTASIAITWNTK